MGEAVIRRSRVDDDLEVVWVPIAIGPSLDGHDLAVEAFGYRIGDRMVTVRDHVVELSCQHPRDGLDRLQPAANGPCVPAIEESPRPAFGLVGSEVPQILFDGPGPGRLQVGPAKLTQFRTPLWRHVLFGGDPEVPRPLEAIVSVLKEQAVLAPPHDVDGLGHVLHDVEAIEDDLGSGKRDGFEGGLDVGFPHVHGHGLDGLDLSWRPHLEISSQTGFFSVIRDIFDRAAIDIADDGHSPMPLAECLLIDADAGDLDSVFPSEPTLCANDR